MIPRRFILVTLIVFAVGGIASAQTQAVFPTLSVSPAIAITGEPLGVTWAAPPESSSSDWIGLYHLGAPNSAFLCVHFTGGAESGAFQCSEAVSPGVYEFRYLLDNGYTSVAASNPVTVESSSGFNLQVSDNITFGGGPITISWTSPAERPTTDWIALFRHGEPDNRDYDPARWLYTNGAASGSQTFSMPTEPGEYVFRYLVRNTWLDVAESAVITVSEFSIQLSAPWIYRGEPLTLSFTAPVNRGPNDWIGLFQVGEPNTAPISLRYLNGESTGAVTFDFVAPAGDYEFRYFTDNSYQLAAVSKVVAVYEPVGFGLTVSETNVAPGQSIVVQWVAPAGRPSVDWIALFVSGADNRLFGQWIYTGGAESGSATFTVPAAPGVYEFRYLMSDRYTAVANSQPVTVGLE